MSRYKIELKTEYSVEASSLEEATEKALKQVEYDLISGVDLNDIFNTKEIKT